MVIDAAEVFLNEFGRPAEDTGEFTGEVGLIGETAAGGDARPGFTGFKCLEASPTDAAQAGEFLGRHADVAMEAAQQLAVADGEAAAE